MLTTVVQPLLRRLGPREATNADDRETAAATARIHPKGRRVDLATAFATCGGVAVVFLAARAPPTEGPAWIDGRGHRNILAPSLRAHIPTAAALARERARIEAPTGPSPQVSALTHCTRSSSLPGARRCVVVNVVRAGGWLATGAAAAAAISAPQTHRRPRPPICAERQRSRVSAVFPSVPAASEWSAARSSWPRRSPPPRGFVSVPAEAAPDVLGAVLSEKMAGARFVGRFRARAPTC